MTIGTALVVVAVLYFIDKYNLWKKAGLVCLISVGTALVGGAGYYGWHTWQEKKSPAAPVTITPDVQAPVTITPDDPYASIATPLWNTKRPPEGYVWDDVSYAILYPVKADQKAKTEAWTWFRDSICARSDDFPQATIIVHGSTAYSLDKYENQWLWDTDLPDRVKQALWRAKAKECKLPPGSRVKACLNSETGTLKDDWFAQFGGTLTNCGPDAEMVYLKGEVHQKIDTGLAIPNPFLEKKK